MSDVNEPTFHQWISQYAQQTMTNLSAYCWSTTNLELGHGDSEYIGIETKFSLDSLSIHPIESSKKPSCSSDPHKVALNLSDGLEHNGDLRTSCALRDFPFSYLTTGAGTLSGTAISKVPLNILDLSLRFSKILSTLNRGLS